MMAPAWGVLIATTEGASFGEGIDPVFLTLSSRPVLTYSLSAFERCPDVEGLVLVAAKDRVESVRSMVQLFGCSKAKKILPAGASILSTLHSVLDAMGEEKISVITVHDASRPLVTSAQISETIQAARKQGAALLAAPVRESIVRTERSTKVSESIDSGNLWTVGSPRSYKIDILRKALAAAHKKKLSVVDESQTLPLVKVAPYVVPGDRSTTRIQAPSDLMLVETLLRR